MLVFEASRYSDEGMGEALSIANRDFVELGITSLHEAGGYGPDQMRAMYRAVAEGRVKVRIYAMVCSLNESEGFVEKMVVTGVGDERFKIGPAKIFTDGSSSGPTCAMREPYASDPSDSGILYYSQEEMDGILGVAHREGFQVTAHAMGDRAVEIWHRGRQARRPGGPRRLHTLRLARGDNSSVSYRDDDRRRDRLRR